MAKYLQWTGQLEEVVEKAATVGGRVEALVNMLGQLEDEQVADGLLSGILEAKKEDGRLVIQFAVPLLFDRHPCRIKPRGLVASVCNPNWSFHLVRPALDHNERLARASEYHRADTAISVSEFQERTEAAHAKAMALPGCVNLAKAVRLPLCFPKTEIADLGQITEDFVTAAGKSYCRQFPNRSFKNYRQGDLAGQVSIVSGSRYEQFIQALTQSAVVANYYPNPLQGYSVDAQREQMASLPEGFILSGPLDTAMGWVMYPDVLARDFKTPGYDCSAVQWQSSEFSLGFKACDDEADFDYRADLSNAYDDYSGGLLFVG